MNMFIGEYEINGHMTRKKEESPEFYFILQTFNSPSTTFFTEIPYYNMVCGTK